MIICIQIFDLLHIIILSIFYTYLYIYKSIYTAYPMSFRARLFRQALLWFCPVLFSALLAFKLEAPIGWPYLRPGPGAVGRCCQGGFTMRKWWLNPGGLTMKPGGWTLVVELLDKKYGGWMMKHVELVSEFKQETWGIYVCLMVRNGECSWQWGIWWIFHQQQQQKNVYVYICICIYVYIYIWGYVWGMFDGIRLIWWNISPAFFFSSGASGFKTRNFWRFSPAKVETTWDRTVFHWIYVGNDGDI